MRVDIVVHDEDNPKKYRVIKNFPIRKRVALVLNRGDVLGLYIVLYKDYGSSGRLWDIHVIEPKGEETNEDLALRMTLPRS